MPRFVRYNEPLEASILMPVYNERTVVEWCLAQVLSAPLPEEMERELAASERRDERGDKSQPEQNLRALLLVIQPCSARIAHQQNCAEDIRTTVWIWRRVDPVLPWRGLLLILVARK